MGILIKDGWILTWNGKKAEFKRGYVWVEGNLIKEVKVDEGERQDNGRQKVLEQQCSLVIDAKNCAVLPGFINAHSHLFQTYIRGLADDKPLFMWLKTAVWPLALNMTEEDFYLAALIGCLENLKCGSTTVIDMHYVHTVKASSDMVLQAMRDAGIRGYLCRTSADQNYHPPLMEDKDTVFKEMDRLLSKWQRETGGRLNVALGLLNPWACSSELVRTAAEYARNNDIFIQIHVAESEAVVQKTIEKYGQRNVDWLKAQGLLGENIQYVHGVWLEDDELEVLSQSGVSLVHCPIANMYLASGAARVTDWLKKDINVALATDGPGSNNSQDMLEVLKFTACLQKLRTMDAAAISCDEVLCMATQGGARALGREDLGVLREGAKADIITVRLDRPHISPVHRIESALIYNANGGDVDTVLVDGRVVVWKGRSTLVDEEEIWEKAQKRAQTLRRKLYEGSQGV
ncbi:5-methylthioadenosine/S-adenosylhomocysteine deaminase [Thermanaeromonas toyohensis ToBE]|uniref:5-methylthioadenosine/S-adenosylhomocysteine deaminase n=1 Tax=Thermanaeromonas toyohensis ToBE TaxID=698762 RepID=A0A1W1VFC4_9FIRM|nr:amidohydrolase [Thermanaeromonas toyohensis]SMB92052.1 5-methylthioadenosine/S-adenosylhomocysteine deaminase [Thermanaeromonas toyohensis ToBE]